MTVKEQITEEVRVALNSLYSSPQAAFMDGSYDRIRETMMQLDKKFRAENAELKTEIRLLSEQLQATINQCSQQEARWEKLKAALSEDKDCLHCLNVLKEMHELESGGSGNMLGKDQACEHCDNRKTCNIYNDHLGGDSIYTIQQSYDSGGCKNLRINGKTIHEAISREPKKKEMKKEGRDEADTRKRC